MIHLDVTQGTEAWFRARIGLPTASEFHKILTPKTLRLSSQSDAYLDKLVAEYLLNTPFEVETHVWAMDVGLEREQEAVEFYELTTGLITQSVGFCLTDDRAAGASPDRFAGTDGLVEIKCPLAPTHVGYLRAGVLPDNYLIQVQGQLWVTGKCWTDFLSYYPGLPSFMVRIEPDLRIQDALSTVLAEFCLRLDAAKAQLKELMP